MNRRFAPVILCAPLWLKAFDFIVDHRGLCKRDALPNAHDFRGTTLRQRSIQVNVAPIHKQMLTGSVTGFF